MNQGTDFSDIGSRIFEHLRKVKRIYVRLLEGGVVESDDGPLFFTTNGRELLGVRLADSASPEQVAAFRCLLNLQSLTRNLTGEARIEAAAWYCLGLNAGLELGGIRTELRTDDLQTKIQALTSHRAKGGRSSSRFKTKEEELKAFELVKAETVGEKPDNGAYTRTAAKWLKSEGIEISPSSFRRLYIRLAQ